VTLTVTVPAETTFMSAGDGGIESGGLITWNLGDLSPGNTGQLTFTLYIDSAVSALTLGSEMVSTEGLRHQTSSECQAQEPYHVYLPMMSRNYPTITVLTAEIPAQPIQPVTLGETFYSAPLTLIETVPAGGRFYLSNHPDGIAPIWVDDQLALVKNDSDIFTFTFSDGENVHAAIVEVPRTIVESIAAGGVTLEYRDVYGVNGSSSAVWLIWVP
jgi:hypothetical protein